MLHPNPNARAQSMREVLEHPFFGLGKLAGKAPVFKRPELGAQSDTNAMDINAYTDEHLANRHEYIAEAEEKAKTPKKEEVPAVIQVEEEPEEEEVEEEPEVVAEPEPAPEVKAPAPAPRPPPQAAPAPAARPVSPAAAPAAAPSAAAAKKKSRFGFGKKK